MRDAAEADGRASGQGPERVQRLMRELKRECADRQNKAAALAAEVSAAAAAAVATSGPRFPNGISVGAATALAVKGTLSRSASAQPELFRDRADGSSPKGKSSGKASPSRGGPAFGASASSSAAGGQASPAPQFQTLGPSLQASSWMPAALDAVCHRVCSLEDRVDTLQAQLDASASCSKAADLNGSQERRLSELVDRAHRRLEVYCQALIRDHFHDLVQRCEQHADGSVPVAGSAVLVDRKADGIAPDPRIPCMPPTHTVAEGSPGCGGGGAGITLGSGSIAGSASAAVACCGASAPPPSGPLVVQHKVMPQKPGGVVRLRSHESASGASAQLLVATSAAQNAPPTLGAGSGICHACCASPPSCSSPSTLRHVPRSASSPALPPSTLAPPTAKGLVVGGSALVTIASLPGGAASAATSAAEAAASGAKADASHLSQTDADSATMAQMSPLSCAQPLQAQGWRSPGLEPMPPGGGYLSYMATRSPSPTRVHTTRHSLGPAEPMFGGFCSAPTLGLGSSVSITPPQRSALPSSSALIAFATPWSACQQGQPLAQQGALRSLSPAPGQRGCATPSSAPPGASVSTAACGASEGEITHL